MVTHIKPPGDRSVEFDLILGDLRAFEFASE